MFLKKRATLEEDNAAGLKKVCRSTQDSMRRPDHRTGTFSHAYDEMIYIHERMAENGSGFATSLQQMHDDLNEMAASAERSRKHWKTTGLAAEQKVVDLDNTVRKSKAKYDSLAEEYERARTGEGSKKVIYAFKNKSSARRGSSQEGAGGGLNVPLSRSNATDREGSAGDEPPTRSYQISPRPDQGGRLRPWVANAEVW